MTNTPTNASLTIQRKGTSVSTGVTALVLPARPEIVMMQEVPAGKASEVFFLDGVDIEEQDFLVDGAKRYRVVGVSHWETPRAAHTEVVAESHWGTDA